MKIFIKSLTGLNATLEVESSDTVETMKAKFGESGWAIDQEPLVFAGRQLEDSRSLADYNIREGATIHLVYRIAGGGTIIRTSEDAIESDRSNSDSEDGKKRKRDSSCNDGRGSWSRGRRKGPSSSSRRLIAGSYGSWGWRFWWRGGRKSPRRC